MQTFGSPDSQAYAISQVLKNEYRQQKSLGKFSQTEKYRVEPSGTELGFVTWLHSAILLCDM